MKKRIAVCAVQVPFTRGGAEFHVETLVKELKARGHEAELISIPHKWYPSNQLLKDILIWRMLDLTESDEKKIDIVITTRFPSYFINHPNKKIWLLHQIRSAYDLYGTEFSYFDPSNPEDVEIKEKIVELDTKYLARYKPIFTNSQNVSRRLMKFNKLDSIPLYHPPKLKDKLYCKKYGDYILYVGRLDRLKRVDLLIKSLKYCNKDIKCKIAGTGKDLDRLKKIAKEYDVDKQIEFLGFIPDKEIIKLYSECFAVFFTPIDEDYGYITLESFLAKKPIITSYDSGGPLEFVDDNQNGFVVKSTKPKDYAKKIDLLFHDKTKCTAFGENGYKKIKDITWDNVIKTLIEDENSTI